MAYVEKWVGLDSRARGWRVAVEILKAWGCLWSGHRWMIRDRWPLTSARHAVCTRCRTTLGVKECSTDEEALVILPARRGVGLWIYFTVAMAWCLLLFLFATWQLLHPGK